MKKLEIMWVLRLILAVPFILFLYQHPVGSLWIGIFISATWMSFSALESLDRVTPGPRWVSHLVAYAIWAVYVYVIYRFVSPWVYASVSQMVEAGQNASAFPELFKGVYDNIREALGGYVKPEQIDKAVGYARDALGKHGGELALTAFGIGRQIAFGITVVLLALVLVPLLIITLHTKREVEEEAARNCVNLFCDGKDGLATKTVVGVWKDYVLYGRGIFKAMFMGMIFFTIVYALVLLGFRTYYGGNLPNAALGGYAVLLGIPGGVPIIGGVLNWFTTGYIGLTVWGFAMPSLILFVLQLVVHKSETGFVTPLLMGKHVKVPFLGIIATYLMAIGLFGANIHGFVASFLMMPLAKAIMGNMARLNGGEEQQI